MKVHLFTDGSVNTKLKFGYGAILTLTEIEGNDFDLKRKIRLKRFENTSSSKLEIQTVLWALDELGNINDKVILYTDSQNIVRLPKRQKKLETNNYYSRQNKKIKNEDLYRLFYKYLDSLKLEIVQVEGHKKTKNKNKTDRIFSLVDRASRNALRTEKDE